MADAAFAAVTLRIRCAIGEGAQRARHCRGLLEADPDLLMAAADDYRTLAIPLWTAQASERAAALFFGRDEPARTEPARTAAVAIYDELDAGWDLRRIEAEGRRWGLRRRAPRRPATGWDALTPSERRVAVLVARGMSNVDIAAELYLSRNTVQTHVAHILTKLKVQSRIEVAREVR